MRATRAGRPGAGHPDRPPALREFARYSDCTIGGSLSLAKFPLVERSQKRRLSCAKFGRSPQPIRLNDGGRAKPTGRLAALHEDGAGGRDRDLERDGASQEGRRRVQDGQVKPRERWNRSRSVGAAADRHLRRTGEFTTLL